MYDYIIIGAGLTGSVLARELKDKGNKVMVLEKDEVPGGNCADEIKDNIPVNLHGGHFFHTNNRVAWDYVNSFVNFTPYFHRVKVNYRGIVYTFPINLQTFSEAWDSAYTKEQAQKLLADIGSTYNSPKNFEEVMLNAVGDSLYYTFIYGYTKKHWGMEPKQLPMELAKRVSVRLNYNDQYSLDQYQGMPENGYSDMIRKMLHGVEVIYNTELSPTDLFMVKKHLIYTGPIDAYYNYSLGKLPYRGVQHEESNEDIGCATMNYTGEDVAYTRKICYNYFYPERKSEVFHTHTEYSNNTGKQYPIETKENLELYHAYKEIPNEKVIFAGRLGRYKYIDMDQAVLMALKLVEELDEP
jgi:UDP-galactopyranose mutase